MASAPTSTGSAKVDAVVQKAAAAVPGTPTGFDLYARFALAGAIGCSVTHGALTPVDVGWIIVQEVWRRSDFMDAEGDLESRLSQHQTMLPAGMSNGGDLWRRVSEDMGVTIVFG
ncbi:hypothetical protein BN1708_010719 [Verticillium longisporum]|uniref:Uncharacterized protein n=1 Tax=Verticillium longisporum TaxID=100787 RepID=A0A0G4KUB1_VERLO|nr:hypothetical protein BN1708_010719 [Verticillium longisporum]